MLVHERARERLHSSVLRLLLREPCGLDLAEVDRREELLMRVALLPEDGSVG